MNRYVEFNIVKFLKDSNIWEKEIKRLENELESITEIKGMDNSPIRSGKLRDSVSEVAAAREKVQNRIDYIRFYQNALKRALKSLADDEKEVIELFFFSSGYIPQKIEKYGAKHALCRSDVYAKRRLALEHLSEYMSRRFL